MNTISIVCDSKEILLKTKYGVDEITNFLLLNSGNELVTMTDEISNERIALKPSKVSILRCLHSEDSQPINCVIKIDGEAIAESVINSINQRNKRIGNVLLNI